jgi:hypothetical protein
VRLLFKELKCPQTHKLSDGRRAPETPADRARQNVITSRSVPTIPIPNGRKAIWLPKRGSVFRHLRGRPDVDSCPADEEPPQYR